MTCIDLKLPQLPEIPQILLGGFTLPTLPTEFTFCCAFEIPIATKINGVIAGFNAAVATGVGLLSADVMALIIEAEIAEAGIQEVLDQIKFSVDCPLNGDLI